ESGQLSRKCLFEDRSETVSQRRVVAFTRHVDEAGGEALKRITANEQRNALPFLEVEDPDDRIKQRVFIGVEQLVARERLQDVQRRLPARAGRRQPGPFYDPTNLATQQWDRARTATVGERGKETEEQANADDLSTRAKAAQADRIHVRGAVNRRAAV